MFPLFILLSQLSPVLTHVAFCVILTGKLLVSWLLSHTILERRNTPWHSAPYSQEGYSFSWLFYKKKEVTCLHFPPTRTWLSRYPRNLDPKTMTGQRSRLVTVCVSSSRVVSSVWKSGLLDHRTVVSTFIRQAAVRVGSRLQLQSLLKVRYWS